MLLLALMKLCGIGDCVVLLGKESGNSSEEKRHNNIGILWLRLPEG